MRPLITVVALLVLASIEGRLAAADPPWIEVRSPHFTVVSNASENSTRALAWQFEQIRSALVTLWPWARVDLTKPLLVLAARDESTMKMLAPDGWEKGGIRPVSVGATGTDQHYIALRADVRNDDRDTENPYQSAYFSYVTTILRASFDRSLPQWFIRGVGEVMSNTIVRDDFLLVGAPLPSNVRILRERGRQPLSRLIATERNSRDVTELERLWVFDAQSWALAHYLMFGDNGARQKDFARYGALLQAGKEPTAAFTEAFGGADNLEKPYGDYLQRNIFSYMKVVADVGVKREGFTMRPVSAAEALAVRAAFHVASQRPVEAAAAVDASRKADPNLALADVAEGLLLESVRKTDLAKAAFKKAVDRDVPSAYAHFRFAILSWSGNPGEADMQLIEKSLARAIALNNRYADAYGALGEARAVLKQPPTAVVPLIRRAISLEPGEAWHRLTAARAFLRLEMDEDALKEVQIARALAETEREKQEAEKLLKMIEQSKKPGN